MYGRLMKVPIALSKFILPTTVPLFGRGPEGGLAVDLLCGILTQIA
jgi:hypothetical protein